VLRNLRVSAGVSVVALTSPNNHNQQQRNWHFSCSLPHTVADAVMSPVALGQAGYSSATVFLLYPSCGAKALW